MPRCLKTRSNVYFARPEPPPKAPSAETTLKFLCAAGKVRFVLTTPPAFPPPSRSNVIFANTGLGLRINSGLDASPLIVQGKYDDEIEFNQTPGATCACERYLYNIPFAAIINKSTKHRDYLSEHDFLGKEGNRVVSEVTEPPWKSGEEATASALTSASKHERLTLVGLKAS